MALKFFITLPSWVGSMSPHLDSRLCDWQVELSWSDASLSGSYKVPARCTIRSFAFMAPQCCSPQVLAGDKDTLTDPGHTACDVQHADGLLQLVAASEPTTALVGNHWGCTCSTPLPHLPLLTLFIPSQFKEVLFCGIHWLVGKPLQAMHSSKEVPTHLSVPLLSNGLLWPIHYLFWLQHLLEYLCYRLGDQN